MNRSAVCALLLFAATCSAETIEGRVVSVADGDTITILSADFIQHKIRLAGIDAPEKNQAFGQRSKQSLSNLVFGKVVQVQTNKRDKYKREVGQVFIDGNDANLEQVKLGMAWHYKAYEKEQSADAQKVYADAENEAKAARLGLWADLVPVAPWDFRHNK